MSLDLQTITNSRLGVSLALSLAGGTPPRLGYYLADRLARWFSGRRGTAMVSAVRLNQWMASGEGLLGAALDEQVQATFAHTARCLYDLYHNLFNRPAMAALVRFEDSARCIFGQGEWLERGMVIACPHLSNFDFVGRALALHGMRAQVLTIAQPHSGYRYQNRMREEVGIEITPITPASLRKASQRLQKGGLVATGLDRPTPGSKHRPVFFGRPSAAPTGHIRLAIKERVPVVVATALMSADGIYHLLASDPIEMQPHPDRETEIIQNAEAVLRIAEGFIRQAPQQWSMFYPVWPEVAVPEG